MDGSSADFGVTIAEGGSGGLVEMLGMFGEQVGRDGLATAVVDEWGCVVLVSPVVGVVELVEFGESLGGAGRVAEPAGADTAYFGAGAFVGVVRHGGDVFVRSAGVWRDDRQHENGPREAEIHR